MSGTFVRTMTHIVTHILSVLTCHVFGRHVESSNPFDRRIANTEYEPNPINV